MGNPQNYEGKCGDQRPDEETWVGASQPESRDNGDQGECKFAESEEPVFAAQVRSF
jgi:hypothetical protein